MRQHARTIWIPGQKPQDRAELQPHQRWRTVSQPPHLLPPFFPPITRWYTLCGTNGTAWTGAMQRASYAVWVKHIEQRQRKQATLTLRQPNNQYKQCCGGIIVSSAWRLTVCTRHFHPLWLAITHGDCSASARRVFSCGRCCHDFWDSRGK